MFLCCNHPFLDVYTTSTTYRCIDIHITQTQTIDSILSLYYVNTHHVHPTGTQNWIGRSNRGRLPLDLSCCTILYVYMYILVTGSNACSKGSWCYCCCCYGDSHDGKPFDVLHEIADLCILYPSSWRYIEWWFLMGGGVNLRPYTCVYVFDCVCVCVLLYVLVPWRNNQTWFRLLERNLVIVIRCTTWRHFCFR